MILPECDDPRVKARIKLIYQVVGSQDSTRQDHERHDSLMREINRDFAVLTPGDRERLESAIRRATGK